MAESHRFGGFQWNTLSLYAEDHTFRCEIQSFYDSINWNALCRFASKLNDGKDCAPDPQWTVGGCHLVRIINFHDGPRWIARLRMTTKMSEDEQSGLLQREVDCLQLVKERNSVPVPMVFGYIARTQNEIGAPFMLMECLPGNTGVDLNHDNGYRVPSKYKSSFCKELARLQTEISSITFSKIGTIIRLEDGTYDVGPFPGLGGPFNTATEYLKAWAKAARFPSLSRAKDGCGEYYDEVMAQIVDFPHKLEALAASIPVRDHGPFPLCHQDFGHNNILVDDDYKVVGVIDWEHACSVPWECVHFPSTLSVIPAPMMGPYHYDKNGKTTDPGIRSDIFDQAKYINTVKQVEQSNGLSPLLSATLAHQGHQDLADAMELYIDGRFGFYTTVLDVCHHRKQREGEEVLDIFEGARDSEGL